MHPHAECRPIQDVAQRQVIGVRDNDRHAAKDDHLDQARGLDLRAPHVLQRPKAPPAPAAPHVSSSRRGRGEKSEEMRKGTGWEKIAAIGTISGEFCQIVDRSTVAQ